MVLPVPIGLSRRVYLRVIWGPSEGHLGTSLGEVLEVDIWVNSSQFWTHSRPILRNLINNLNLAFIWPWVGLKAGI